MDFHIIILGTWASGWCVAMMEVWFCAGMKAISLVCECKSKPHLTSVVVHICAGEVIISGAMRVHIIKTFVFVALLIFKFIIKDKR